MAMIRLTNLTKRYGEVTAVSGVDLDIAGDDFLVLLGPSGCGKTTLLRLIAGLLEPTEGTVVVGDRDITRLPPRERDLAMVFQSYALYPHLSVERNLGFGLGVRRTPRAEVRRRVHDVAALLDLHALLGRRPKELSGGQRQRVALGRAIVREPKAFLMDEPLSNLDAKLRASTRTELIKLHARLATTFVYVTHDQVDAMTMATRVAVMNAGRIEQVGTPVQIYDEPATVFVAGFMGAPPMNLLDAELRSDERGLLGVHAPDVSVPLWPGAEPPRDIVLGVRPEHLRPVAADHPGPVLRARVEVVENLGSEEVADCLVGSARLAVRGPRPLGLRPGDGVTVSAEPASFHLFDRTSGRRLTWLPDQTAAGVPAGTRDGRALAGAPTAAPDAPSQRR
jgi:multiple sugar transport system ATP-binding protein